MHKYHRPIAIQRAAMPTMAALADLLADRGYDVDPDRLFAIPAEISSTNLDSYYTHMTPRTLDNFAADAARGVAVLDSHDAHKLGVGYSLTGERDSVDGRERALSIGYTVLGVNFGGAHSFASTDDFAAAVSAGMVRDVSVGFHGGEYRCDICGNDYSDYNACQHFAGMKYDRADAEPATCTVAIDDARLAEWSLVYDGATPDAMVLKAQQYAGSRGADFGTLARLERQLRVNLGAQRAYAVGVDLKRATARPVESAANETVQFTPEVSTDMERITIPDDLRALFDGADTAEPGAALEVIRTLSAEADRLRPLADAGRAYRADLVSDAIAEGVRAHGNKFAEDTYRGLLEAAPLETVKRMRDDWARIADAVLPRGRQSQPPAGADAPADTADDGRAPAAAYA